ncbi:hypothetical protein BRADI_2g01104v3 [Brachypodium distachyon]|uniref:Uncharacterized protein n=1 Tax=Brachypodium distachyon TaxID=15368 RepID=A0A0Q3I991_BRADI|nr:hypothetical protein BRADI_2g01104v3 [Brachypodium distachyon]
MLLLAMLGGHPRYAYLVHDPDGYRPGPSPPAPRAQPGRRPYPDPRPRCPGCPLPSPHRKTLQQQQIVHTIN